MSTRSRGLRAAWCGCALLLLLPAIMAPARGRAQGPNRAGVVVQTGEGQVRTACVTFSEPEISGLALLERANLDVLVEPAGDNAKICSIAGTGCPFPRASCWCQCTGAGPCRYWAYWHQIDDAWQFATAGAPLYKVRDGAVDGWSWGSGSAAAGSRPPMLSFEQICRVPATTITAAAPATTTLAPAVPATPAPTQSATPMPQPARSGSTPGDYIVFGGVAALLLVSAAILWKRRR